MNPDISKTFNILRNLVPVKGKLIHDHNGYKVYDLENFRVGLDSVENHDTVNYMDDKGLTGWTISRLEGRFPNVIYNWARFTPEEMVKVAEAFAIRHTVKRY